MRVCDRSGCDRPVLARGWCGTHYAQEAKLCGGFQPRTVQDRFWAKVDKDGPLPDPDTGIGTCCWLWLGSKGNERGYGELSISPGVGKRKVHRL